MKGICNKCFYMAKIKRKYYCCSPWRIKYLGAELRDLTHKEACKIWTLETPVKTKIIKMALEFCQGIK